MLLIPLLVGPLALAAAPSQGAPAGLPCNECAQTVWYVDADSLTNGPGDSWATAFQRLPPAINAAAPGDCIWVAEGVYTPTNSANRAKSFTFNKALNVFGGFAGDELCFSNRKGNFWGTVLSGDIGMPGDSTDNSYTVVSIEGVSVVGMKTDVVLDGFRITDGNNEAVGTSTGGGLLMMAGSKLRLENSFVRRNQAALGGGICSLGGDLSIVDTGIAWNQAKDGAGMYLAGGKVRVFDCAFRRNVASRNGGANYLIGMSPSTVSRWANDIFEGNQADRGGAMYLEVGEIKPPPINVVYPGRAHLVGCTVTRNIASLEGPGLAAIDHPALLDLAGHLQVENSIVWNNTGPKPEIVGWLATDVTYSIVPPTSPFGGGLNLPLDPLMIPPNFRLSNGSPAIDAGINAAILTDELDLDGDGDLLEPTPIDWYERPRVQGGVVDMGASER